MTHEPKIKRKDHQASLWPGIIIGVSLIVLFSVAAIVMFCR